MNAPNPPPHPPPPPPPEGQYPDGTWPLPPPQQPAGEAAAQWDWPQASQLAPTPAPAGPYQAQPYPAQPGQVQPYPGQPGGDQNWGPPAQVPPAPPYDPAQGYGPGPQWQPAPAQAQPYAPVGQSMAAAAAPPVIDVTEPAIDLTRTDPAAAFAQRSIGDVVLRVEDLQVYYGAAVALKGITFDVRQGEVVVIIGANGAGKTTTMKTISGLSEPLKTVKGDVYFRGQNVTKMPAHKVQRLGLAHVPEGRHIFGESTVEDNLLLGSISRQRSASGAEISRDVSRMYERFPVLGDRKNRPAGLLSGGEQQMLAICRALMSRPDVLLLDEPSLGLAPIMINAVFDIIKELAAEGTTILLVEQMANKALDIADRAYVLETGAITLEGTGQALLADERVKAAYLGA